LHWGVNSEVLARRRLAMPNDLPARLRTDPTQWIGLRLAEPHRLVFETRLAGHRQTAVVQSSRREAHSPPACWALLTVARTKGRRQHLPLPPEQAQATSSLSQASSLHLFRRATARRSPPTARLLRSYHCWLETARATPSRYQMAVAAPRYRNSVGRQAPVQARVRALPSGPSRPRASSCRKWQIAAR
jgi:hypothetical protein